MKHLYFIFTFSLLLLSVEVFCQKIEWASKVDNFSSEFSKNRYSAKEVLGVPNVAPVGMSSKYAWRVQPNAIDNEGVETAFIEVSFQSIITAQQIAVFENFNPGAVAEIFIKKEDGQWQSIYLDTAVIKRTGYRNFEDCPNPKMLGMAGTVKSKIHLLKKDSLFLPKSKYNIIHAYFETQKVMAVRIVLNLFAVDGWNEIDAIGLSENAQPIEYPRVRTINEPVFSETQKHHLPASINSEYTEIKPVLSPDAKKLYFVRTNHPDNYHVQTQDIWVSDLENVKVESCKNCEQKFEDQFQEAKHFAKPFNNLLPNAVMGFSSNGKYMFLNNLYQSIKSKCDCDTALKQPSSGISVSHFDTLEWKKSEQSLINKFKEEYKDFYTDFFTHPSKKTIIATHKEIAKKDTVNTVYIAYLQKDTTWTKFEKVGKLAPILPLNLPAEQNQTFDKLYLTINQNKIQTCKTMGWSLPETMLIDDFENNSNYIDFDIADDGKTMLLSLQNTDSKGDRDLYVCFKKSDNSWTKPIALGETINTISDDCSPFIDDDGVTLYFASAGHNGYGDLDIYVTRRLDDSWTRWSKPLNLGKRVNTINSDNFFNISPQTRMAYFSSTDNAIGCKGLSDIYSIGMKHTINLKIAGTVYNVDTKKKLQANITLNALQDSTEMGYRKMTFFSDEKTGKYEINITEMLENEQISDFCLIAERKNFIMTDSKAKPIAFDRIDVAKTKRNALIQKDLFMKGEDKKEELITVIPSKKQEPTNDKEKKNPIYSFNPVSKVDTVVEYRTIFKTDTVFVRDNVNIQIVDTARYSSCSTLYHNGNLYFMPAVRNKEAIQIRFMNVAYEKYFEYNDKNIDRDDISFREFLDKQLKGKLKILSKGDKLKIHIVSSASRVPTRAYTSNYGLSEGRAGVASVQIRNYLKSNNISENTYEITEENFVQGPKYNDDARTNKSEYQKYQYVKIWIMICE